MVRVSGFLDQGVDVERERRRRLPTPTNNRVRDNNYSAGNSNFHQQQQPIRSHEETSAVINHSKFTRDEQQYSGRGETFSSNLQKSSQVRNQERLRPTILSITPRIVKQESIEMEPLLSNSVSQPSILPLSSRKDGNRIANTMRTDITMGAQVKNHRNLHSSNPTTYRESRLAQPLRYNYVLIDDEEGDIVCCDDCFRHEGTKNICTIVIWAAFVFFIMNRFFLHMSIYLHKGEETKVAVGGDNFTSPG